MGKCEIDVSFQACHLQIGLPSQSSNPSILKGLSFGTARLNTPMPTNITYFDYWAVLITTDSLVRFVLWMPVLRLRTDLFKKFPERVGLIAQCREPNKSHFRAISTVIRPHY